MSAPQLAELLAEISALAAAAPDRAVADALRRWASAPSLYELDHPRALLASLLGALRTEAEARRARQK